MAGIQAFAACPICWNVPPTSTGVCACAVTTEASATAVTDKILRFIAMPSPQKATPSDFISGFPKKLARVLPAHTFPSSVVVQSAGAFAFFCLQSGVSCFRTSSCLARNCPIAVRRGLIYVPASSLLKSRNDRALLHMAASRQYRQTRNCQPNTHPLHCKSPLERHAIACYLTLAEELVGVCLPCRITPYWAGMLPLTSEIMRWHQN